MLSSWTKTQCAYVAGVLDIAGSFIISNPNHGFSCRIQIITTKRDVLERLARLTGAPVLLHYNTNPFYKRQQWRINWNGCESAIILERVKPYMTRKTEQAEIIQRFARTVNPDRRRISTTTRQERSLCYRRMRQLHQLIGTAK